MALINYNTVTSKEGYSALYNILFSFKSSFYSAFRLSGISPFFYEDEDKVVKSVQKVKWKFDATAFADVTSEAQDLSLIHI